MKWIILSATIIAVIITIILIVYFGTSSTIVSTTTEVGVVTPDFTLAVTSYEPSTNAHTTTLPFYNASNENSTETWFMLIAGFNGVFPASSVQLFSFPSGRICDLKNIPLATRGPAAAFFEDHAIYCGGFGFTIFYKYCFKYNSTTSKWKMISDLTGSFQYGVSVVVSSGLYLFGGTYTNMPQFLATLDSKWVVTLPDSYSWTGSCSVQLNDTVTAFLGGNTDAYTITTYDWLSANYTKITTLKFPRIRPTCALLQVSPGHRVVAIIGSDITFSKGMEIWDPTDNTVNRVLNQLPQEIDGQQALRGAQMMSVNDDQQLIIFNGYNGQYLKDIWLYTHQSNFWARIGATSDTISDGCVIKVNGMTCP